MAAIVGTRTSPLPAGDPGGGRDRHGGQSVSSPAMSERAAAGRAYLERTQLAELMRYLGPRLDTVGTVIVGVAAAAVYLLTTSTDPTPFDYFVRLADAFLHGRLYLLEAPTVAQRAGAP